MTTYLEIVSPVNDRGWLGTVPHDAGQVHSAILVYVHLRLTDDYRHGLYGGERKDVTYHMEVDY